MAGTICDMTHPNKLSFSECEFVLVDLAVYGPAANSQNLCSLGLISVGICQGLPNVLALGFAGITERGGNGFAAHYEFRWQVIDGNHISTAEDKRMFQCIFELSHIPRPVISHEEIPDLR